MAVKDPENPHPSWLGKIAPLFLLLVIGLAAWLIFGRGGDDAADGDRSQNAGQVEEEPESATGQTLEKAEIEFPSFDIVRVSRGGTGVIAGRAAPNSEVEVQADGKTLGRTRADGNGDWVLIFEEPLKSGGVELSLESALPGQSSVESRSIVVVVVPPKSEEKFIESDGEGVVAIMSPRDRIGKSVIMQRPGPTVPGEVAGGLALETMDYNDTDTVIINGRANPEAQVRVYLDNKFIGSTVANSDGDWTLSPDDVLSPGEHVLRVDQVVDEGNVQVRLEVPFDRSRALDLKTVSGQIVVQPGNSLWHISRKVFGAGFHYTTIFNANQSQIKNPDLIYPGQVFELPSNTAE